MRFAARYANRTSFSSSYVDHLNTPRLVADAAGTAVWRWDQQEPFGDNVADENPSGLGDFNLPLRLPGQRYDKETGLHYNYFRDYDPSIGGYKQSDLIGLYAGLNTYAYGEGSPVEWTDFFGLCMIQVRFKPIPGGSTVGIFHAYIVTTGPGGGTPKFFRGGPDGPRTVSSWPMWGTIQIVTGPYVADTPDWDPGIPPSIVVLDNDEPCTCYDQSFTATLNAINAARITYVPAFSNSNSVIGTALSQAGFNLPSPRFSHQDSATICLDTSAEGTRSDVSRPKASRHRLRRRCHHFGRGNHYPHFLRTQRERVANATRSGAPRREHAGAGG